MPNHEKLRELAKLAVKIGVNVQKGHLARQTYTN